MRCPYCTYFKCILFLFRRYLCISTVLFSFITAPVGYGNISSCSLCVHATVPEGSESGSTTCHCSLCNRSVQYATKLRYCKTENFHNREILRIRDVRKFATGKFHEFLVRGYAMGFSTFSQQEISTNSRKINKFSCTRVFAVLQYYKQAVYQPTTGAKHRYQNLDMASR